MRGVSRARGWRLLGLRLVLALVRDDRVCGALVALVGQDDQPGRLQLGQDAPDLSCSGLVTTPAEVVEEGSGLGGDAGLGGYLLGADGDGG